jgi:hypothetical protein
LQLVLDFTAILAIAVTVFWTAIYSEGTLVLNKWLHGMESHLELSVHVLQFFDTLAIKLHFNLLDL